jgi:hypothetical protein
MKRNGTIEKLLLLGIVTLLLAVACTATTGNETAAPAGEQEAVEPESAGEETAELPATEPAGEEATEEPVETVEEEAPEEKSVAEPAAVTLGELSLSWATEKIGEGIKPALAIDGDGVVHAAFMTEARMGGVFYTNNESGFFEPEAVSEGYFYGPLDIAVTADGQPFIAYHDHQAERFDPNKGDAVVAASSADGWELTIVSDPGHDGWDNSIAVDSDGNWHAAGIDPAQFGRMSGVEYATNAGGSLSVEEVGSGPIVYEFATSVALDNEGRPGVTYYDDKVQALAYASHDGSTWSVELVDQNGDAGRYAALAYDADGNPHISYFVFESETAGMVRYARWDGSAWGIENVDTLDDVQAGMVGARKITSLAIDEGGTIHLAYSDRNHIVYGQRDESGWAVGEVPQVSDNPLGQLVELALDPDGNPHLIWFEVFNDAPLDGDIIYAAGS